MNKILLIILAVVVIVGGYGLVSYNGLVSLREASTAQWQQVETQYQRRFDLIPNLVESVKGIMEQEKSIFLALADARSRYSGAQTVNDKVQAASQVEGALGRLLAVVENYPTLNSSANVQSLMDQLEGAENRIATERQRFNDSVRVYNVAIKTFPRSVIASMFGFGELDYFEAQNGAENVPAVSF